MLSDPPTLKPSPAQKQVRYVRWIGLAIALYLLFDWLTSLLAEGLWFQEVEYLQFFVIRLGTQSLLAGLGFGVSLAILLWNLAIARRCAWSPSDAKQVTQPLSWRLHLLHLLPLTLVLSLTIGVLVIYHGQIAISNWHPNLNLDSAASAVPINFRPGVFWQVGQTLRAQPWQMGALGALTVALLIYPQTLLQAIALLMSAGFGIVLAEQWGNLLLFLSPTAFEQSDPLYGQDIGFYIFRLPVWELLDFWLIGLLLLTLVSVSLTYLLSGNSLSQGWFPGFSSPQRRHLSALAGCFMLAIALDYWLSRYDLLYSRRGVTYGASYTDVNVQLPVYVVLSLAALGLGVFLLWRAIAWSDRASRPPAGTGGSPAASQRSASTGIQARFPQLYSVRPSVQTVTHSGSSASFLRGSSTQPGVPSSNRLPQVGTPYAAAKPGNATPPRQHSRLIIGLLAGYVILAVLAGLVLPFGVQRFGVQPNELERERPYIENAIALTRAAFDLENIEVEAFDPKDNLTYTDLLDNPLTINNIRLWDTRPLLVTNRQLQRIRLYYEFPDADIDRYALRTPEGTTEQRQVLIAARELDYRAVPAEAQTWVNQHLIYTHGYGFTMSPVNTAGDGGLPDYFIRGIEHIASDELIQESIPVGQPRIYYGEITDNYVMTNTKVRELDFPSGSDNIYNTYDGRGGIAIGDYWRRLLFAKHLKDWRMLFTNDFTPETRLLFRRNIGERVNAIAPFLRYDRDPYLVVANTTGFRTRGETNNYLYWIIDAYTTSKHYPYSDPANNDFNYIRNSVKVVVDAYNGSVDFYVANESDPIIQSWRRIFPGMLHPLSEMPEPLRDHIRYPQDFFQVQSNQLMVYHMTDPQVFYNREDQWRQASEIYANEQQQVEPYYLLMRLPNSELGEFILLSPFTPDQRRNLIAWLAARSDGQRYGTMLLYRFPKQELVYGPEQIEARINQDPVISQQISLWNRQGSRAIQGNLLVIPIEESLLYVEPLYLEAEQNQIPTLVRVIIVYENRIAMAPTLNEALQAVFQPDTPGDETIIRSVEDPLIPSEEGVEEPAAASAADTL